MTRLDNRVVDLAIRQSCLGGTRGYHQPCDSKNSVNQFSRMAGTGQHWDSETLHFSSSRRFATTDSFRPA